MQRNIFLYSAHLIILDDNVDNVFREEPHTEDYNGSGDDDCLINDSNAYNLGVAIGVIGMIMWYALSAMHPNMTVENS